MQLKIVTGDITKVECDAIVNSTSSDLIPSGAIDTAIHNAAGPNLEKACMAYGKCEVGECVVTPGFWLHCDYIMHVVAPYSDDDSAAHLLATCYKVAINRAIQKNCSSIAFPLIGSGAKGFSKKKAIDVAVRRIEACMRDSNKDLLIQLVLLDNETATLVKTHAKEVIAPNYLVNEDEPDNVDIKEGKRWVSLCKVNRPDKHNDIWMQRIADAIGGTLIIPALDESKDQIFDNRTLIFCENGPNDPDIIGFWEWSERLSGSGRWFSDATYVAQSTPIEMIVFNTISSEEEVIEYLKSGQHIPAYVRGKILFTFKQNDLYKGVLCELNDFDIRPGNGVFIRLKSSVHTLPYYELSENDIILWKNRKIYRHLVLGEPQKYITINAPTEVIKQMLLQNMNWPIFKAQGISKNDWQKFRQFVNAIPNSSILEVLTETYAMTSEEAQHCIDAFLSSVEKHIQIEDVDSSLIVQMLDHHEGLKKVCDEAAYEKWLEEHKIELEKAKEEITEIKVQADKKAADLKQNLSAIEKELSDAKENRENILAETISAQNKLAQIIAEIEQYEELGNNTVNAVRQKIADAQKDMAGFIAELSVFVSSQPQSATSAERVALWNYEEPAKDVYAAEEVEVADSWEDEFNTIYQNLSSTFSVKPELNELLTAFLYAAHIHRSPILIAGPAGEDFAEIMALSIGGDGAGKLILGSEYDNDMVNIVKSYNEGIVSIHNLFGKGWSETLPETFAKMKKHIFWSHPYVEDLVVEPKGLYNYMLPMFSECFVETLRTNVAWPSRRSDKFKAFVSKEKHPLCLKSLTRLGLSKFTLNKLEVVLSTAKELLDKKAKEKDLEVMFGLLPFSVLMGKTSVLKDVIETENGISEVVKEEAMRFLEEEV